jgi:hypothetical protein
MSTIWNFDWSIIQNASWSAILQVVAFLILIVAIGIAHRRVSLLAREMQQLSEDVRALSAAEQRRFLQELKLQELDLKELESQQTNKIQRPAQRGSGKRRVMLEN